MIEEDKYGQALKGLQARYRKIFSGGGQEVLADILYKCKFFEECQNQDDIIRHNLAVSILEMCGVIEFDDAGIINTTELTKRLFGKE